MDGSQHVTYRTRSGVVPPPAISSFTAIDEGNSSPRFMRMTTYSIPTASDVQKSCQIPLGFALQPLADLGAGEVCLIFIVFANVCKQEGIPVVDFGPNGPIRCIRCKAYINPFVNFINGGRQYVCRMCEVVNDGMHVIIKPNRFIVPREYFSPLEANGRRSDFLSRPELCKGTVEFVATKEYMERPPKAASYLFALDVSFTSVSSGLLQLTIDSIKRLLTVWPQDPNVKIGFITYDTAVHFYNLNVRLLHYYSYL
jgi:protein transport protein SEC24